MPIALAYLSCLLAGAVTPFAIEPYSHWYLGIISTGVLAWQLHQPLTKKQLLLRSFVFGIGYFGIGVSWVFVSISQFGSESLAVAVTLTALFVIMIAAVFALPFYGLGYFALTPWRLLLGFPLFWTLSEWLRTWLLTGFPWLFLGYGHIDTPLGGWAPVGGVLLVSLLAALMAAAAASLLVKSISGQLKILALIAAVLFWVEGKALTGIAWTDKSADPVTVGIVQPNIPQALKWAADYRQTTRDILTGVSADLWQQDWIIWPEAAVPELYHQSQDFLTVMDRQARDTNTSLITGILYDDQGRYAYYNGLLGLGEAKGLYFKQRLVPFGEYVPLESWLRGLIALFNLPTSVISAGSSDQIGLRANDIAIASAICYEIVYPGLIARLAKDAQVIVTVSNDAWFGNSIGPPQHFHMARMRALETGRYVIRSTNNGISAIIEPDGNVQQQTPQFIRTSLKGTFMPMSGNTPYLIWKNYLVLVLLALMAVVLIIKQRQQFMQT